MPRQPDHPGQDTQMYMGVRSFRIESVDFDNISSGRVARRTVTVVGRIFDLPTFQGSAMAYTALYCVP
jgi:hypothetical protein